jgi:hypothetical protein
MVAAASDGIMGRMDLSEYRISFSRNALGVWGFRIEGPDGLEIRNSGGHLGRQSAERAAYMDIRRHAERETIDGNELQRRVAAQSPLVQHVP